MRRQKAPALGLFQGQNLNLQRESQGRKILEKYEIQLVCVGSKPGMGTVLLRCSTKKLKKENLQSSRLVLGDEEEPLIATEDSPRQCQSSTAKRNKESDPEEEKALRKKGFNLKRMRQASGFEDLL
eukprot:TRINITY_DN4938_c0_g1_i4.p1 TRINITY_DN4938_c0_g1~~TRINITY_DN4938_c0_g1_i4.p1  ORF type:complete len:126 (-),score=31.16 TRINITY_DN4938_c0_g1_i4:153-530(-)